MEKILRRWVIKKRIQDTEELLIKKSRDSIKEISHAVDPHVIILTNYFIESYRPLLKKLSKS